MALDFPNRVSSYWLITNDAAEQEVRRHLLIHCAIRSLTPDTEGPPNSTSAEPFHSQHPHHPPQGHRAGGLSPDGKTAHGGVSTRGCTLMRAAKDLEMRS
ncbi:hypothetical protein ACFXPV_06450 [Streptomyces sp. NPDC059118]|uniref:hypothetical protein n=1 Tax=unclassified Streptomyces TaxID=2593676 RepID=UPI00369D2A6F